MVFLVLINGGETRALRSIRMEGLQQFCKQNKQFCVQKERMDGKLSQTKLSGLKIYYLSLTLRVVFFIPNYGSCIQGTMFACSKFGNKKIIKFLDLGSNAK